MKKLILLCSLLGLTSNTWAHFPKLANQGNDQELHLETMNCEVGNSVYEVARLMEQRKSYQDRTRQGTISFNKGEEGWVSARFFIVADGHGKDAFVASYLAERFPQKIVIQLARNEGNYEAALGMIFEELEEEIAALEAALYSGSTLLICLLLENGVFYTAHVGDSFAQQQGGWTTQDHSPGNAHAIYFRKEDGAMISEKERIAVAGGTIEVSEKWGTSARLNGWIKLTRAIGNFSYNERGALQKVKALSAEPFIEKGFLPENETLVLASDGIRREDICLSETISATATRTNTRARDRGEKDDISLFVIRRSS